MSIPERFYRIAKYKLREIKDRFDQLDQESSRDSDVARKPNLSRAEATRELDETIAQAPATGIPRSSSSSVSSLRSPEEISPGLRPTSVTTTTTNAGGAALTSTSSGSTATVEPVREDPLAFHYRLLGVPVGSEFVTAQQAYNRLAARSDPSRFPAGSEEEKQAQEIRTRLDGSFNALRDALDPTARRFDLLEY